VYTKLCLQRQQIEVILRFNIHDMTVSIESKDIALSIVYIFKLIHQVCYK